MWVSKQIYYVDKQQYAKIIFNHWRMKLTNKAKNLVS